MTDFKKYGVAGIDIDNPELAMSYTYTKSNGAFPSTNLACEDNPYKPQLTTSKYILDFGCGVGRNLPWIMNNTSAVYVGIDPNTSMTRHFWEVQETMWPEKLEEYNVKSWKERSIIVNDFSEIPKGITFDYVVSTFVMQHLGYRFSTDSQLNLTGITKKIMSKTKQDTVWFLIEHDSEEDWIPLWLDENGIQLDVYIRGYKGLPELTDRDHCAPNGGNHLMIFKQKQ